MGGLPRPQWMQVAGGARGEREVLGAQRLWERGVGLRGEEENPLVCPLRAHLGLKAPESLWVCTSQQRAEQPVPCPFAPQLELLPPSVYLVTCAVHGTPEASAGGGREGEFTSLPLQWLCSSWNTMDTHAHRDTWTHKQQTHTNRQRHTWTQTHTNIQRHRDT